MEPVIGSCKRSNQQVSDVGNLALPGLSLDALWDVPPKRLKAASGTYLNAVHDNSSRQDARWVRFDMHECMHPYIHGSASC